MKMSEVLNEAIKLYFEGGDWKAYIRGIKDEGYIRECDFKDLVSRP
jgi:hypothetical protein